MRGLTTIVVLFVLLALLAGGSSLCAAPAVSPPAPSPKNPVTSYKQMTAQLASDAAGSDWVRVASAGKSVQGRTLWLTRLADPASRPADTVRVLVLCRQHGDEPASTEALLRLIHGIAQGQDAPLRANLRHVTLYVVPMVNPDGAQAGTRVNGAGADLNRDWGLWTQPETRAMAHLIAALRPDAIIDAHNWDGGDALNTDCLEISRAMLTPLGAASHALQQQSAHDLAAGGYPVKSFGYGPERDPRLAHRWCARQGFLSMLVETHAGRPSDTPDFTHRQEMYIALVQSLARHFAALGPAQRLALRRLGSGSWAASREAALFPPPSMPARLAHGPSHWPLPARTKAPWLWALAAYPLALWLWGLGRITPASQSEKAWTPGRVPATERRSAGRRARPRYRYSRSAPALQPAPAACARKQ